MRKDHILPFAALAVLGLTALGAMKLAQTQTERPGCPGQIVCPQTGELICRDQCATADPDRADCPGRIICPDTGELVCIDRCPVRAGAASADQADPPPSCCPGGDKTTRKP